MLNVDTITGPDVDEAHPLQAWVCIRNAHAFLLRPKSEEAAVKAQRELQARGIFPTAHEPRGW